MSNRNRDNMALDNADAGNAALLDPPESGPPGPEELGEPGNAASRPLPA